MPAAGLQTCSLENIRSLDAAATLRYARAVYGSAAAAVAVAQGLRAFWDRVDVVWHDFLPASLASCSWSLSPAPGAVYTRFHVASQQHYPEGTMDDAFVALGFAPVLWIYRFSSVIRPGDLPDRGPATEHAITPPVDAEQYEQRWVEVLHYNVQENATKVLWTYLARGSGMWLFTGATAVYRDHTDLAVAMNVSREECDSCYRKEEHIGIDKGMKMSDVAMLLERAARFYDTVVFELHVDMWALHREYPDCSPPGVQLRALNHSHSFHWDLPSAEIPRVNTTNVSMCHESGKKKLTGGEFRTEIVSLRSLRGENGRSTTHRLLPYGDAPPWIAAGWPPSITNPCILARTMRCLVPPPPPSRTPSCADGLFASRTARWQQQRGTPVINLGLTKSGSSAAYVAVARSGWGGTTARKGMCNKWVGVPATFAHVKALASGNASDWHPLRRILGECSQVGDNPWWLIARQLLYEYPGARFILTGFSGGSRPYDWEAGCVAWANSSARSFWECHEGGKLDWMHACWAGAKAFDANLFARRCQEHHRQVVGTARALGRTMLLLGTDWSDAQKWAALDAFLNTSAAAVESRTAAFGAAFPVVQTLSSKRGCDHVVASHRLHRTGTGTPRSMYMYPGLNVHVPTFGGN